MLKEMSDAGCECVERIVLSSGRTGSVIYIVNNLVGQSALLLVLLMTGRNST